MRLHNRHLEAVIRRETTSEIIAALTPIETLIVWFRLCNMSNADIAKLINYTELAVTRRLLYAKHRICERVPHATDLIDAPAPPGPPPADTVSIREAAAELKRPVPTLQYWAKHKKIKTLRHGTNRHYRIPLAELERLKRSL